MTDEKYPVAELGIVRLVDSISNDSKPINIITPDRADHSVDLWIQGYSCSECVVMPFADEFGLEPDLAARISSGFGFSAGLDKEKTCGVVTGALMVIGLKYGAGLKGEQYARDICTMAVQDFFTRFLVRRKSVLCKKVHLSYDQNLEKTERVRHLRGYKAFCANLTKEAVEILEEMFGEDDS